jgi:hypothetical protein
MERSDSVMERSDSHIFHISRFRPTAGDLAFLRKEMNQIYSVMLSRKHKAGPAGNTLSLPEVDQQRKDTRMKPTGLPEKRRKLVFKI